MGWTSYRAEHYKNGTIDRKAECDAYFMEGLNKGHYNVFKSAMVGSVYYAAVQDLVKYAGKDENGERKYEPIPESERTTWGCVFLTSVDTKEYFNFSYKDMDETCGPYQYDCPKGILDLLSPTDNEFALKWREECRRTLAKKKDSNALNNLPFGTEIKVTMPFDTNLFEKGDEVVLKKRKNRKNRTEWVAERYLVRFSTSLMKSLNDSYVVESLGG